MPLPFPGSTQVHSLALMPNPDYSLSWLAVSCCDTTELVKQAWQSAHLCRPGARPISPPSLTPSYPPHASPCLSWGLGEAGAFRQISVSHKGLCTSSPCLGFAVMSPDATISQFQSTRCWWDLALLFACKLCTSNTRRKEERRRDAFTGFLLQKLCPQELQHVSADRYIGFAVRW